MLLLLFIILLIVFSIPAVQTTVAKRVANSINEKNNVNISIGGIGLTYSGNVELDRVLIKDHHLDTLIYAAEIQTSILGFNNLLNNNPHLGNTQVKQLQLDMKIYEGEEKDNLAIFLNKFKSEKKKKSTPFQLTASEINLVDGHFSYINENARNEEILVLDHLNILARDLNIYGNEVAVNILKLSGIEKRGLDIENLEARFALTDSQMKLEDFVLATPNSKIRADIVFDASKGFSNFADKVNITANFKEASISSTDLENFYSEFGKGQQLNFNTTLEGTLNDFSLSNFELEGMNRTVLSGDFEVENLFNSREGIFRINGDINLLATNYYDLVNLLPGVLYGKLPEEIRRLGNVRMIGDAFLTENSLDAELMLFSELGSADVDLVLGNFGNSELATYEGILKVDDFNLGRLLNEKSLGETSFNLNIDGRGFTRESLNTNVRGSIFEFGYNNYVYNDIKIRGILKAPLFNGNLISFDPNLNMEFNGLADFSEEINVYDFNASVGYADLAALNFIKRDSISIFKGDILMNMAGTNLNNMFGEISLRNTSYKNHNDTYRFEDLSITSTFDGPVRTITVNSPDVINGSVEGIFDITEVGALFENAIGSLYTNYRPNKLTTNQYLE
ncbi:MAG TPA: translocation/assembly module TamB, partial [Salinimicrobium sp.]|nr:translocation/assembly module TamB [Salinimicrobium sp.]